MSVAVATVEVPLQLLAEVDEIVGPEQRALFVTEAMQAELRRRRMRKFLDDARTLGPAWKDEDHPELAEGTYEWIRKIRAEWGPREKAIEAAWRGE